MKKKIYKKPSIKFRVLGADSAILAASIRTPIDNEHPSTGGGDAKQNSINFMEKDNNASSNNIWDE